VRGGKALAILELALRACANEALSPNDDDSTRQSQSALLWGKVCVCVYVFACVRACGAAHVCQ